LNSVTGGLPAIVHGDWLAEASKAAGHRGWTLVTSAGWLEHGLRERVDSLSNPPIDAVVAPSPLTLDALLLAARGGSKSEVVVAIGGGSVIDCGKVLALSQGFEDRDRHRVGRWFADGLILRPTLPLPDIIAVPTLPGSGAEATPFATIWDGARKRSLDHPSLLPCCIILDAKLPRSAPDEVRLFAALDGLAHALEAVWNRNATPQSNHLSMRAIRMFAEALPHVVAPPSPRWVRPLMEASYLAGRAIAITRTALSHSISYPFTAELGVPHGLASSFTLPAVARRALLADRDWVAPIANALNCSADAIPSVLQEILDASSLRNHAKKHLAPGMLAKIKEPLLDQSRAPNFIAGVNESETRLIAEHALASACA